MRRVFKDSLLKRFANLFNGAAGHTHRKWRYHLLPGSLLPPSKDRILAKVVAACRANALRATKGGNLKKAAASGGFTLIELAVVLTIISLLVGGGLSLSVASTERLRAQTTHERMIFILNAIDNYVDNPGASAQLPCPADGTDTFSDDAFGIETACTASGTRIGTVPTATLNIPPEYMLDGWNRRITYIVDGNLTTTAGFSGNNGTLTVENIANTDLRTDVAVILISHGPNGFGAWPGRGGSRQGVDGGGADEDLNDDSESAGDDTFVQSPIQSEFDDIVYYRTKWQLTGTEE